MPKTALQGGGGAASSGQPLVGDGAIAKLQALPLDVTLRRDPDGQ